MSTRISRPDWFASPFDSLNRWVSAAIIFGFWTLFGLFFATQRYIERAYDGRPTSWSKVLTAWAICAYLWAALTPLVLWLTNRFAFEPKRWPRPLILHIVAGLLVSVFHLAIYLVALQFVLGTDGPSFNSLVSMRDMLVAALHFNLLLYAAIVGIGHFISHYRQKRERELSAAQLEATLAQAQLDALRLQLRPHFLFNTLNTISVLIPKDAKTAQRTVERLSDLLRALLKHSELQEVTLTEELAFLRTYLEIEQIRFPDRLTVTMVIDPVTLDASVPSLILQPLVENAIKHGIASRNEASQIEIRTERLNGVIRLQVRDDGPGLAEGPRLEATGIGLSNTKARLERLYGEQSSLELGNAPGGGTVVTILIPFNPADRPRLER